LQAWTLPWVASALVGLTVGCAPEAAEVVPPPAATLSLLAVGDTGRPPERDPEGFRLRVGAAMAAEDRRLAVDAVVLLGDNFYPGGLLEAELAHRVRENVARPFCHFVRLDGPRSAEVADACPAPAAERHPVPILAVLGNHDYDTRGSARLQRSVLPEFIPNWRMTEGTTGTETLHPRVDLLLLDTSRIFAGRTKRRRVLAESFATSRSPWLVVAGHHPPTVGSASDDSIATAEAAAFFEQAVERSGVRPQLWIAGHEHNLQLHRGGGEGPALTAIAGAGSEPRQPGPRPGAIFAGSGLGFARIDLVGAGDDEALVVTLFTVDPRPGDPPTPVAQARVTTRGEVSTP